MGGQIHAPADLPQERDMLLFHKRLGGPEGRSGRVGMSPPPRFDPGPSKLVASRYNDYAIPPLVITNVEYYKAESRRSITSTPDFMKIGQIIQELNAGDSQMTSNLTKRTERKRT